MIGPWNQVSWHRIAGSNAAGPACYSIPIRPRSGLAPVLSRPAHRGHALPKNLTREIHDCCAHADTWARKAETAGSEDLRRDFLQLEQGWLTLARSYEFAMQAIDFSAAAKRQRAPRSGLAPEPRDRNAAIIPLLSGRAFEPEALSAMSIAFERACNALGLAVSSDPATETIAKKIIELAQRGVHDTGALCRMTLEEFGHHG